MATTTPNFGWSVPTSTDLVKDGATAIETLGDSIDASLVDLKGGTSGQVLAKNSNTDMDFVWVAQDDSNAIQNSLLTTTGDTIYASAASTPARLAIGSTGNVLTVAGGVPTWAAPAAGGKVLQVVSALITTSTSIASTTLTDSSITLNITPTSATSKVLVMISAHMSSQRSTDAAYSKLKILRDATTIWDGTNVNISYGFEGSGSGATFTRILTTQGFTVLDSPATTSAITYKLQAAVNTTANSGTIVCQPDTNPSSITLMEIGA